MEDDAAAGTPSLFGSLLRVALTATHFDSVQFKVNST